uniref:Uncharacterized protein n=1 Tax=Polynucleobacter necessarius subsp. necessarius (strain STIR1) TaxID=452638 RepID=B1XVS7_POLNS
MTDEKKPDSKIPAKIVIAKLPVAHPFQKDRLALLEGLRQAFGGGKA